MCAERAYQKILSTSLIFGQFFFLHVLNIIKNHVPSLKYLRWNLPLKYFGFHIIYMSYYELIAHFFHVSKRNNVHTNFKWDDIVFLWTLHGWWYPYEKQFTRCKNVDNDACCKCKWQTNTLENHAKVDVLCTNWLWL